MGSDPPAIWWWIWFQNKAGAVGTEPFADKAAKHGISDIESDWTLQMTYLPALDSTLLVYNDGAIE